MALKGFWDRLRGRDAPAAEPEPPIPPPAVPVQPDVNTPPVYDVEPSLDLPPAPPAATPELPPAVPPRDDAAAEREALADSVPEPQPEPEQKGGWFARLKQGLSRSTARLTDAITTVFRKRRLDDEALEELEETLITADLGVPASRRIVEDFRRTRFGKEVTEEEVKAALAESIAGILDPVARPLEIVPARAPHVVLVVGVHGPGKPTTIA